MLLLSILSDCASMHIIIAARNWDLLCKCKTLAMTKVPSCERNSVHVKWLISELAHRCILTAASQLLTGVVVGFDDEIGQMDVHVRSTLAKHATKTLLCDAYQEDLAQHLGKSSGNVAMYLEALGTAAKVRSGEAC